MMTKVGNVWVSVDSKGNVTKVHGTGLDADPTPIVVEIVDVDTDALIDPFTLVMGR